MKTLICTIVAGLFLCNLSFSQVDNVGPGRAMKFDGLDDYIDLGNRYDDLVFPFTVSAWVYFAPGDTGGPVLVTQDNAPIYNGFWFFARPSLIFIEYGDGLGENLSTFRRGKISNFANMTDRWLHYAAVVRGPFDMDLYVNGINVGGSSTGDSLNPMASNFPQDNAKIGTFLSNGVTYRFKGIIDDLRLYRRSLSADEIRSSMTKKLTTSETGLIGYWTFNETAGNDLNDSSPNHFGGTLLGGPSHLFSGAAIGDENKVLYQSNFAGVQMNLSALTADNFTATAGAHVYKVNSPPSQTSGLAAAMEYYGVFIADLQDSKTFSVKLTSADICMAYKRKDNTVSQWVQTTTVNATDRVELVFGGGEIVDVDLGKDIYLCDRESFTLFASTHGATSPSFVWSTGQAGNSIVVNKSGQYWVRSSTSCNTDTDTIKVVFNYSPPAFSLGKDTVICRFEDPVKLTAPVGLFSILWDDRTSAGQRLIQAHGSYWLTLQNECGFSSDTITFSLPTFNPTTVPNVITPNGDDLNQAFQLRLGTDADVVIFNRWGKKVYEAFGYKDDWDASGLASGTYFYVLNKPCVGEKKGVVTVIR